MKPLAYLSFFSISLLFLFATVKSHPENDLPVGTVIYSVLPPTDFVKANGKNWVLLTGQKKKEFDTSELGKYWQKDLPDARGMFIRGMNDLQGNGADPDKTRQVGNLQKDTLKHHTHLYTAKKRVKPDDGNGPVVWFVEGEGERTQNYESMKGNSETRPKNIALYIYIKVN